MIYKVKVCDRFNTIEWETESPNVEECQRMYDILAKMNLRDDVAVITKKKTVTTTTSSSNPQVGKPASEAQLRLLRQKNVPHEDDITAKEAWHLLQKYSSIYPNKNIE